jgi:signal transduction histidine kinase/CheY-like chemotaxis protein
VVDPGSGSPIGDGRLPSLPTVFASFLEVAGDRVQPCTLSEATAIALCHSLEDLVAADGPPAAVLGGFQPERDLGLPRRLEGAGADHGDPVGRPGGRVGASVEVQRFRIESGPQQPREWFAIALTRRFCAALFGRDLPDQDVTDESDRSYATVWTFDPAVVANVCEVLASSADRGVPGEQLVPGAPDAVRAAVRDHRPRPASPEVVQRFANVMFERLEAEQRRWRAASADVAATRSQLAARTRRQLHLERIAAARTLASSITHELNNPLASITMAASVLRTSEDAPRRERMTEIIQEQALRAGRIASRLSSFVSNGPVEQSELDLDAWVAGLAADYRLAGRSVTVSGRVPDRVTTDPDRLRQAIISLVDDGLQASGPHGGVDIEVGIDAAMAVIAVVDRGPAIPADAVGDLFDPLGAPQGPSHGTGLSLAIARSHIEAIGGVLDLEGSGEDGTRFAIRIPVAPVQAAVEETPAEEPAVEQAPEPERPVAEATTPERALVVDDDAPIRGLLEALLRRGGWEVVGTGGRGEAVAAVEAAPFDLALIDVRLGIEEGPQVLRELVEVQPDLAGRAAFMTGAPPDSGRIAGCPVLGKPFTWADLSRLIAELQGGQDPGRPPSTL